MEFKDNLYRIRKEKGISQEELAIQCNVSRQAISKWENGSANPDLENLKILAISLQISIDELLGYESEIEIKNDEKVVFIFGRPWTKEYISRWKIFGIPLLHVNIGRGRRDDGKRHVAKGIIAIGNVGIGLISIGMMSVGICSFGLLTLGIFLGIGVLSLSYIAIGALSIGYFAIGSIAIGLYSLGALSIGYQIGVGALAYGEIAIGVQAYGVQSLLLQSNHSCILQSQDYQAIQTILQQSDLPYLFEMALKSIQLC